MGSVEAGVEVTACLGSIHFQWYSQKEGALAAGEKVPWRAVPVTTKIQARFSDALVPLSCQQQSGSTPLHPACVAVLAHGCLHTREKYESSMLTYFPFPWKRTWKSSKKWIVPLNFKSLKIAPYWGFNSFLNVNSEKYLLFKHEYPSAFSHHWKRIIFFSPLNSRDHSH